MFFSCRSYCSPSSFRSHHNPSVCRSHCVPSPCRSHHNPSVCRSHSNPSSCRLLLRLLPPDSRQSAALVELIRFFRWDTMALLSDNTDYGASHPL